MKNSKEVTNGTTDNKEKETAFILPSGINKEQEKSNKSRCWWGCFWKNAGNSREYGTKPDKKQTN